MSEGPPGGAAVEGAQPTREALLGAIAAGRLELSALQARLADPSWTTRREAVAALASLGNAALAGLCASLREQRDDETRIAATVDALVSSTGDVEAELAPTVLDADPALLADVAQILGKRRRPSSVPALIRLTDHADDNVAVAAIEGLGRIGGRAAVDALVACVERDRFFRTFPALDVLGRSGDPRAVVPIARLLSNPRYAFEAARALGRTAERGAVAPLGQLLSSPTEASVRVACLALSELCERHAALYGMATSIEEGLRRLGSPALVRRLGQSLSGADKAEKMAICRVLGAFRDSAAVPWLLPMLDAESELAACAAAALRELGRASDDVIAGALSEPHSARRASLLPSITRRAHTTAVEACLRDGDPAVRALACEALARIGAIGATPALFRLLEDGSPRVVYAATAALQSLGSSETEVLASAAARSSKVETRRAALRVLAYFGYASAYELFAAALRDPDPRVRDAAVQGLPLLEHPAATPLLLEVARGPNPRLRAAATRSLGQCAADPALIATLRSGLGDADPWVRYYACQALGKLKLEEAAADLVERLQDSAGQVRVAAVEALSHLHAGPGFAALREGALAEDVDLRRAAILGLGLAKDVASLPTIVEAVLRADAATRLVALSALAQFDAAVVTPTLAQAARDQDEAVRTAAIGFLANVSGVEATRALIALLATASERGPYLDALARPHEARVPELLAALEWADDELAPLLGSCLVRLRSGPAFAALCQAFMLPQRPARLAAAKALAALGHREAYAVLARAAAEDPDDEVRRVCSLHLGT